MEYKLIRSKRKTVELSIDDELCPMIKAPLHMPQRDIDAFFEKHHSWVQKHTKAKRERLEKTAATPEAEAAAKQNALPYLTERTNYFSRLMGLEPKEIKITSAQKRFGSCNGKNSICYSWRLMLFRRRQLTMWWCMSLLILHTRIMARNFINLLKNICPIIKKERKCCDETDFKKRAARKHT